MAGHRGMKQVLEAVQQDKKGTLTAFRRRRDRKHVDNVKGFAK